MVAYFQTDFVLTLAIYKSVCKNQSEALWTVALIISENVDAF